MSIDWINGDACNNRYPRINVAEVLLTGGNVQCLEHSIIMKTIQVRHQCALEISSWLALNYGALYRCNPEHIVSYHVQVMRH